MIVYLICAEINNERLYKIGYTKRTVQQRIKEFKTGNASEFLIIETYKSKWSTKIEALLKKKFISVNINGEWFKLSDEQIQNFRNSCDIIHNNLELISNNNTYYLNKGDF